MLCPDHLNHRTSACLTIPGKTELQSSLCFPSGMTLGVTGAPSNLSILSPKRTYPSEGHMGLE